MNNSAGSESNPQVSPISIRGVIAQFLAVFLILYVMFIAAMMTLATPQEIFTIGTPLSFLISAMITLFFKPRDYLAAIRWWQNI